MPIEELESEIERLSKLNNLYFILYYNTKLNDNDYLIKQELEKNTKLQTLLFEKLKEWKGE